MSVLEEMARAACPGIGDVVAIMIERGEIAPSSGPIHYDTMLQSAIKSMRAALAEARRQGWKLVPVEADKNMMIAGAAAITAYVKDDETDAGDVHRAMIAAAPDVEG